jgi:hypothetical protein
MELPSITCENLYDYFVVEDFERGEVEDCDGFYLEQNYDLTKSLSFTDEMEEQLHNKIFNEIHLNYDTFNTTRSCMWVEEVKRRAKWTRGETLYGYSREKHLTYPIWWSRDKTKIGSYFAWILDADGYVSFPLHNGYTRNETEDIKIINYIRLECLYNDKNCNEV